MTKHGMLIHLRRLSKEGVLLESKHGPHSSFKLAQASEVPGGDDATGRSSPTASDDALKLFFVAASWLVRTHKGDFVTIKQLEAALRRANGPIGRAIVDVLSRRLQEYGFLMDTVKGTRNRGR